MAALIPLALLLLGAAVVYRLQFAHRPTGDRRGLLLAIAGCALGGVVLLLVLLRSSQWRGSTEIVWEALEAGQRDGVVTIGGAREADGIGWPAGASWPRLTAEPATAQAARLRLDGGRAFLRDSTGYVNGTPLLDGRLAGAGEYAVRYDRKAKRLAVLTPAGEPLVDFPVRPDGAQRCLPLAVLIEPRLHRLRADSRDTLACGLERWAQPLRVLLGDKAGPRLLAPDDSTVVTALNGSRWTLLWSGMRQSFVPERTRDGRMRVFFPPPWKVTSPLPAPDLFDRLSIAPHASRSATGDDDAQPVSLVVTGRARPGDCAFLLPLGGGLTNASYAVTLRDGRFVAASTTSSPAGAAPHRQSGELSPVFEVRSERSIPIGHFIVQLATARDLPRPGWLALALLLALLAFAGTLLVGTRHMTAGDALDIAALATVAFLLLVMRLLLAYRFALDPAHLDPLAVKGVTIALMALALLPGTVILSAAITNAERTGPAPAASGEDDEERRALLAWWLPLLWLSVGQIVVLGLVRWACGRLWPNFPVPFVTMHTVLFAGLAVASLLRIFLHSVRHAMPALPANLPTLSVPAPAPVRTFGRWCLSFLGWCWRAGSAAVLVLPTLFQTVGTKVGPAIWGEVVRTTHDEEDLGSEFTRSRTFFARYGAVCALVFVLLVASFFASPLLGGKKGLQEVIAPLVFLWLPATVLLSSRIRLTPRSKPVRVQRWRLFWLTLLLFAATAAYPVALHDPGSLFASLTVLLPTVIVLAAGRRPPHVAAAAVAAVGLALVCAFYLYINIEDLVARKTNLPGESAVRMLIFKEGWQRSEERLANLPVLEDRSVANFTTTELAQGLQHSWENAAMAHVGGVLGLGFGHAPTRRSQVRQDTVQFDSTFSFFVLGEYGAVGGLALLLLFALPLVVVLRRGARGFDVGHGLAAVIAAALFMEAFLQAGMNLGKLPFTGRSMPMLAVDSFSDALKWTVLLALLAQAFFWGSGRRVPDAPEKQSLVSPQPTDAEGNVVARVGREPRSAIVAVAGGLGALVVAAWLTIAYACVENQLNGELSNPFDWSGLLKQVDGYAAAGTLRWDAVRQMIVVDSTRDFVRSALIAQELHRFNALPPSEKLEGLTASEYDSVAARLRGVHTLARFDSTMAYLRALAARRVEPARPSLFDLSPPIEWADVDQQIPAAETVRIVRANLDYNTHVSFQTGVEAADFPVVTFRDNVQGGWALTGQGVDLALTEQGRAGDQRRVDLQLQPDGTLRVLKDSRPGLGQVAVYVHYEDPHRARARSPLFATFQWRGDALELIAPRGGDPKTTGLALRVVHAADGQPKRIDAGATEPLAEGDLVQTRVNIMKGVQLSMSVRRGYDGALIGPAWVMGELVPATNPGAGVPWTRTLATGLGDAWGHLHAREAHRQYGRLSLDRALQRAAQEFVARKGRTLHARLLGLRDTSWRSALPPRVALSILDVANGEVLALGGWPRTAAGERWERQPDGEWLPPATWSSRDAPRELRNRYGGDRNFDRMLVGSETKPLIAAAVLSLHEGLQDRLRVRGGAGDDGTVFGVPVGPPWSVHASYGMAGGEWTDLTAFLAHSDNRYEVRLGFLGLAEPDLNTAEHVARERRHGGALLESMNGGASAWTNTPRYPESVLFSQDEPLHMGGLADQPLAAKLRGMFAVGARLRDVDRRLSFWSGVEAVDWNWRDSTDALVRRWRPSRRMWAISPEAANLTLDWIDTPRKYVSVLLGGGSNSWANVDMAGAFATCVRGEAVVPHIVAGADVQPYGRQDFPEVAELLRPGLEQVILSRNGTAHDPLVRGGGMTVLQGLGKDIHVYGKTGTLAATAGERNNSRFVLAIVRQTGRHIDGGVVLSMVAERADMGTCSEWVGGFLAQHEAWLRARLAAVPAATGPTPAKSRAQRGHGKKAGRGHAGAGA